MEKIIDDWTIQHFRVEWITSSIKVPVMLPSKRLNLPPTEGLTCTEAQVNARINSGCVRTLYNSTGGHLKFWLHVYDCISTFTPICSCFISGVLTEDGSFTPGSFVTWVLSPFFTSVSFFGKIIPWVKSEWWNNKGETKQESALTIHQLSYKNTNILLLTFF